MKLMVSVRGLVFTGETRSADEYIRHLVASARGSQRARAEAENAYMPDNYPRMMKATEKFNPLVDSEADEYLHLFEVNLGNLGATWWRCRLDQIDGWELDEGRHIMPSSLQPNVR
jgi:hypothetical protein